MFTAEGASRSVETVFETILFFNSPLRERMDKIMGTCFIVLYSRQLHKIHSYTWKLKKRK